MASSRRPQNRGDFEVAIICALQAEFEAVEGLLDEHWEDKGAYAHGKAQGDPNSYSVGLMSNHPVVLVYMPSMGKGTAANVAGSLRSSFPGIKLGLVVGICGGVPAGKNGGSDMLLGDIIISTVIVEYDNGRQLPNRVVRRDTLNDNRIPALTLPISLRKNILRNGDIQVLMKTPSSNLGIATNTKEPHVVRLAPTAGTGTIRSARLLLDQAVFNLGVKPVSRSLVADWKKLKLPFGAQVPLQCHEMER
ncbi:hypothetical protein TWF225_005242 [Orbilia oligospora]|nr:hypothetical protein TWF225_005242 [Orbilia oligospora]